MQGVAVGEDAHQLLARHARPVADVAGVHVDEGRAGGRVEADAAELHLQADRAQLGERHVGNVEVHRLAEHVLAVLGDALRAAAEHAVGRRRAIAAHHLDVIVRSGLLVDLPEQVEQMRVHLDHAVLAPVAQELVERLEAVAVVNAIALVDDDGALVGVEIVEPERPLAGEAVSRGRRPSAKAPRHRS